VAQERAARARHARRRGGTCGPPRGQALLFTLPLLAALSAALLLVFDSGQATNDKQRLVDATDAAALSAATWQARALNFEAGMTRAVIANEVAIAQAVSLRSWSAYMRISLRDVATLTRWLPYVNAATAALQRFWEGFDQGLQPAAEGIEGLLSLVSHDLAAAQRYMHLATLEAVPEAVRGTLQENDPRFVLSAGGDALLLRWAVDWGRFTSLYGGAWRWRQEDVLTRSLDGFTVNRGASLKPLLGSDVLAFEKRGGTELIDFETWRGLDTLSMHTPRFVLFGPLRERVPLAWGAAENGMATPRQVSHGGSARTNPRATRLARLAMRSSRLYRGLPSLRDLSVEQRATLDVPRIAVRAEFPASGLKLGAQLLGVTRLADLAGHGIATSEAPAGDAVFAQSSAEVHFSRTERRADGATEQASLYNPYWRPRLVVVSAAERASGAAVDGVANPALDLAP
jgi:Flp pilus assembly protein TadG